MKEKTTQLVCLVGMGGSGKSIVADEFVKAGYGYVRFGQFVLDKVKEHRLEPTEENERTFRNSLRKEHGMAAMAILNIPKFDELLKKGNVLGDGLYSWSEYKILRERYGNRFFVIAVYAPPALRYARLANRRADVKDDPTHRYRSFDPESARERDEDEIEEVEKGGPIAMADYLIKNEGSLEELLAETRTVLTLIEEKSTLHA